MGARWPARYVVRVDGALDARWSDWFEGLQVETQGSQTVISGSVADRSALYGILDRVCDLGLSVVDVHRVPEEEEG
jgi:hypothetical protein